MARLSRLFYYPVKSIAGLSPRSSLVEPHGLKDDRRFVITDPEGNFLTARVYPELSLIRASHCDGGFTLIAPGMKPLIVRPGQFKPGYNQVAIWQDKVQAQYTSEVCDAWFSAFLNKPCRLHFYGEQTRRFAYATEKPVSFADGYPLLLISDASLAALNQKLEMPVSMQRFRPNVVVDECDAFAEDGWSEVKIGEVEFVVHSPCVRCVFTTISPITGRPDGQKEPLFTLSKFRSDSEKNVYFGQNLIPQNTGQLNVGDKVSVLAGQHRPYFHDNAPAKASLSDIERPERAFYLRCVDVQQETPDIKTFVFAFEDGVVRPHFPGQHVAISATINGKLVRRRYTVSSAPDSKHLSITVKRVPQGEMSVFLHDEFTAGSYLLVESLGGSFYLSGEHHREKLLLISAGSGVTPMLSMLRTLVARKARADIIYIHCAKDAENIVAEQEVSALASSLLQCDIRYYLTHVDGSAPAHHFHQRFEASLLANIDDLNDRHVFFCGPDSLRQACEDFLFAAGLPEKQFSYERFTAGVVASQRPFEALSIHHGPSNQTFAGDNQSPVLEQCEKQGIALPFSCRAGVCGECKVNLRSGKADCPVELDGLTEEEVKAGYILACSYVPSTDISIG